MNKLMQVVSRIKLKDYEKRWISSWLAFAIVTPILLQNFPDDAGFFGGVLAFLWVIWVAVNICGLIYVIATLVVDWVRNLSYESWIRRVIRWFCTSDR